MVARFFLAVCCSLVWIGVAPALDKPLAKAKATRALSVHTPRQRQPFAPHAAKPLHTYIKAASVTPTALRLQAPQAPPAVSAPPKTALRKPPVRAKALFCVDCGSNKTMLAQNISQPLPIASITKLLTALVVVESFDLEKVVEVPAYINEIERHKVGIRPGDLFTVRDLLHGMLIESGNDCAEALASAYPKGGREGFLIAMNRKAKALGALRTTIYTPSGLDLKIVLGKKDGRVLEARKPNTASAENVALIARQAFRNKLIAGITSMRTHTMRTKNFIAKDYQLFSNDKLLTRNLPVAGAKTGYTNMAGKCIVALFKHENREHMVVVLNTTHHFKAAERIYRWACRVF